MHSFKALVGSGIRIGSGDEEDWWTGAVTYSPSDSGDPSLDNLKPQGLVVYVKGDQPPRWLLVFLHSFSCCPTNLMFTFLWASMSYNDVSISFTMREISSVNLVVGLDVALL